MIMGVVFNPMMNEFFFAERGKGAFLNNQPISVSKKADFKTACLVTGFPYKSVSYTHLDVYKRQIIWWAFKRKASRSPTITMEDLANPNYLTF